MVTAEWSAAGELRAARAALLGDGLSGRPLRDALVDLYDGWLAGVVTAAAGPDPDVALVAVGGLGRREPAPYSDLDLVLLHRGRPGVKAVADAVWYPVWDAGVGLDHSVRTVAEALAVARDDLKAALGLLELRHLAGDRSLSADLREGAYAAWRQSAQRRLPELRAASLTRWRTAGELAFLLEPDLKEARGGLRDVHALHALAAAQLLDLPGPAVAAARDVLLDARGELHRRAGRGAGPAGAAGAAVDRRGAGPGRRGRRCCARSPTPAGPSLTPPTPPGGRSRASWPLAAGPGR